MTASAASAPFLVAPNDSTSTPHFQLALGRRAAEVRDGIGEARAVHVHPQSVGVGGRRERS